MNPSKSFAEFNSLRSRLSLRSHSLIWLVFAASVISGPLGAKGQDRPPTEELLPETTVFLLQMENWRDFYEKSQQLSIGKILGDDRVAPLINNLWEEAGEVFQQEVGQQMEMNLEELRSLPEGEITLAVIAPRRKDPEFMLIFETDPESGTVDRLIEFGRKEAEAIGEEYTLEEDEEAGFDLESLPFEGRRFTFFRKNGTIVGSTSTDELNDLIDRWKGLEVEKVRPLSQNRKFITIMNRCRGTKDLPPELRFFVDPIELARSATRGDISSQFLINLLPVLGLDGLLGMGGSFLLSEDEFASIAHLHVLLAEPRKGVFQMLAFRPTDYQPEPWMPDKTFNYFTTSWDIPLMLSELTKIIETFQEEGVVDRFFEQNVDTEVGFDFRQDFLGNLSGRVTFAQWIELPLTATSQQSIFSLGVKDPVAMEGLLEKIFERINRDIPEDSGFRWVDESHRGIPVYSMMEEGIRGAQQRRMERENQRRLERGERVFEVELEAGPTQPAFALVGDSLLISPQSRSALLTAIDTEQGKLESLGNNPDFIRVNEKMYRTLRSELPSAIFYSDPSNIFDWMFGLARNENSQAFLQERSEEFEPLGRLKRAWDKNPLPDFSEIEQYVQPQGGFMTSDETGLHLLFFELRQDD